jgi:HSP20 family protein
VTVERGVLKISGERRPDVRAGDMEVQTYAIERPLGRFTRALSLPDDVDTSKVEAKYRDGVLQLSIGLQEGSQPQRITVQ